MTTSTPDLTTQEGLREYLLKEGWPTDTEISVLSGGTANYVYRVTSVQRVASIFKHAAPYLRINNNFPFDPTRMDYEAQILNTLSPAHGPKSLSARLPSSSVHAVRLLSYDQKTKLLCIEDGGRRHLKDAYQDPDLDILKVGQELANWIAALHQSSKDISIALPGQDVNSAKDRNNPVAVNIYRHSYRNLYSALSTYGYDTKLADRINDEFGSLLATDDDHVCHGDFWTGNVLVRLDALQEKHFELTIVDWEMTRRGTGATDVGQFAAEAFLLDRFRGGRGLLAVFLTTYVKARDQSIEGASALGKMWLRRVVVHWAVHIAYWPTRNAWTDREGTQQLVDIGIGVLEAVLEDDWEQILASPLLRDVKGVFASVLDRP